MNKCNPLVPKKRLAIVGAGSSGLVTLKYAIDQLPGWEIVAFEQSDSVRGCWGNPHSDFVSTSTKFTTQFACFPIYSAQVVEDGGKSRSEFFCGDEYGEYLEAFANRFCLHRHVRLRTRVEQLDWEPTKGQWRLRIASLGEVAEVTTEDFDAVVLCTGLAAKSQSVEWKLPELSLQELRSESCLQAIRDKTIVVIGGGESAVDYACRLAKEGLGNRVFLSLKSGIRVSPRYHPIRGVPSDFLRNRLMLSIHPDLRNWIGERFVAMRIRYEPHFRRWFPHRSKLRREEVPRQASKRQFWAMRLTEAAKDDLFNMFHNKSDDFLDCIAQDRLEIVGPPTDETATRFFEFESMESRTIRPDYVVPSIGYRSTLGDLSEGLIRVSDFYLGCQSIRFPQLYLVGFARPIIGNIPSISEMQAAYVIGLISQKIPSDSNVLERHQVDRRKLASRYAKLNLEAIYPVEMFPYCDELANRIHRVPTLWKLQSPGDWLRFQCGPASTIQYFWDDPASRKAAKGLPIYMPAVLIAFLLALLPFDAAYRLSRWAGSIWTRAVGKRSNEG